MDREKMAKEFYIDDHAVLFALFAKYADELAGEIGLEVAGETVTLFGRERGMRCAMRCLKDGEELTVENYTVYGEWVDDKGWSKNIVETIEPSFKTNMTVCGWSESWKKYGLEKYAPIYCSNIDVSLAYGFNPENKFSLDTSISFGDSHCTFHWVDHALESDEQLKAMFEKRSKIVDRVVKDFLYQCGHVLNAFRRTMLYEFGALKGNEIIDRAMAEYTKLFGKDKAELLVEESYQDFLKI